jgi:hypothetical protein
MEGVLDANVFGDGLHLRVRDEGSIENIRIKLANEKIHIQVMKPITPSMEDVFLSLIPAL